MKITLALTDDRATQEQIEIINHAFWNGYLVSLVTLAEQYILNGDADTASCYYFAQQDLWVNQSGINTNALPTLVPSLVTRGDDEDRVF
jgi:hypothetical protein